MIGDLKGVSTVTVGLLAIALGLIGTNPLNPPEKLDPWVCIAFMIFGVVILLGVFIAKRFAAADRPEPTADYLERFGRTQEEIRSLTPDHKILKDVEIGHTKFSAIHGDILEAPTDVVVSSDDNHFTARGGVAKAILKRVGSGPRRELEHFRRCGFRQGQIAITTGGKWKRRAVFHAAVIDLDENRYPNASVIRQLTRRCLDAAVSIGARSIAFPVLGGGTASKFLTAEESVAAIAAEIIDFLNTHGSDEDALAYVALYIYNKEHGKGLPP
ncbi:MAG TPA: macro domain-containing protein [Thermoanaerobaculia bacterium]|nr:macro domain-containing protein [Thermoanaerobaculia bacterium]